MNTLKNQPLPKLPSKLWTPIIIAMAIVWVVLSFKLYLVESIELGYNVPKINPCLRRENDCAQIATYIVMANEGCSVGREAFAQLFDHHQDSGTTLRGWIAAAGRELRVKYHAAGRERDLVRNLRTGYAPMLVAWVPTKAGGLTGHGMVLTGYVNDGWTERWELADARGNRWVSGEKFDEMWSGQWVETGKRI